PRWTKRRGNSLEVASQHSSFSRRMRARVLQKHFQVLPQTRGGGAPTGAPSWPRQRARPRVQRDALASRRSTAALAKALTPRLSSGPAFPEITGCKREDPPRRQCSELLADRS